MSPRRTLGLCVVYILAAGSVLSWCGAGDDITIRGRTPDIHTPIEGRP